MDNIERLLFDCINEKYGNAKYYDGFIYFYDEEGNRFKVAIYTTN